MPSTNKAETNMLMVIQQYMKGNNIKRDDDLKDLYLGNCGIVDLDDMGRYRFLRHIYLHDNKISELCLPKEPDFSFLSINYRISELYLNDNDIKSIAGMLSHLTCLEVLMLQNNQLDDLDETTLELRPMRTLRVLNMLYNPLSQVKGYRHHLIFYCPSVTLFDRQAVTYQERMNASQIYEEKQNAVKRTIAFGRRSDGPPFPKSKTGQANQETLDKEILSKCEKVELPSLEKLIKERTKKKSAMQYTTLDWSLVPDREKRISGEEIPKAQNITISFR